MRISLTVRYDHAFRSLPVEALSVGYVIGCAWLCNKAHSPKSLLGVLGLTAVGLYMNHLIAKSFPLQRTITVIDKQFVVDLPVEEVAMAAVTIFRNYTDV